MSNCKHEHSTCCKHENIKFCSKCLKPYCEDCGKEWEGKCTLQHWPYQWIYTTPTSYGTTTITYEGTAYANTADCQHK